jgi:hypothetical protein
VAPEARPYFFFAAFLVAGFFVVAFFAQHAIRSTPFQGSY